MNKSKFDQLIQEFPFLQTVFSARGLCVDTVDGITIKRGDLNLLAVTPSAWAHDMGEWGNDEGYRLFWFVEKEKVVKLDSAWIRSVVPHGNSWGSRGAKSIGWQLRDLDCQPRFMVELHCPGHDTSCCEEPNPFVVIYKMKGIEWNNCHRQTIIG